MKLSSVFPLLFLLISFVFSSPIPSAVDDIVATTQKLFPQCPDNNPGCHSNESQKALIIIRVLLETLDHAAEDLHLAKPLHQTGQELQKLRETLQTKTKNQDLDVGKSLEGLDHALAELQAFLGEIEKKASLSNIVPTEGGEENQGEEILDKRSGVDSTQQEGQKAQGPEESFNGLGPRNLGTEAGKAGKNLGVVTGKTGKNLGQETGTVGKSLGVLTGKTGKSLGVGAGGTGKDLGVEAAKTGITVEELLAKLVSILN